MKQFIVLYHAPQDAMEQTSNMSKEQQAEGMKAWMTWAEQVGDQLVDLGKPLANGKSLSPDGKHVTSSKDVAGYSILQAKDLDEAIGLLKGHPHLAWNADCRIEVHETMDLPGM